MNCILEGVAELNKLPTMISDVMAAAKQWHVCTVREKVKYNADKLSCLTLKFPFLKQIMVLIKGQPFQNNSSRIQAFIFKEIKLAPAQKISYGSSSSKKQKCKQLVKSSKLMQIKLSCRFFTDHYFDAWLALYQNKTLFRLS